MDETLEHRDPFVQVAIAAELLTVRLGESVLDYARANGVSQKEAALSLEVLSPIQIEAVEYLSDPTALAPGYTITRLLGSGGNGLVFRATQISLNREVALKTINSRSQNDQAIARMRREANAVAQLQHPNIVGVFDCGIYNDKFFIVMELVNGEDLSNYVLKTTHLSELESWYIVRQIAAGLLHAYEAGIIHRDIKPGNILLTERPEGSEVPSGIPFAKIADFGLAIETVDFGDGRITAEGTAIGTPAYVSPEQLKDSSVDHRADIYSLGATAFSMLNGYPPMRKSSPLEAIVAKSVGDDSWRAELDEKVSEPSRQLFLRMTEANLNDRIANYDELIAQIDSVLLEIKGEFQGDTVEVTAAFPRISTNSKLPRKFSLKLLIATFAVIATLLAVAVSLRPKAAEPVLASQWRIHGVSIPLYNGVSTPRRPIQGLWKPAKGLEMENVLLGTTPATIRFPLVMNELPLPQEGSRFRTGIRLLEDAIAEFAIPGNQQTPTLRMTSNAVTLFDRQSRVVAEKSQSYDDTQVRSCQFWFAGSSITIVADGEVIGTVSCSFASIDDATITIACKSGRIELRDIDVCRIQKETEP